MKGKALLWKGKNAMYSEARKVYIVDGGKTAAVSRNSFALLLLIHSLLGDDSNYVEAEHFWG